MPERAGRCRHLTWPPPRPGTPTSATTARPGDFDYDLQVKYGAFGTTSEPPAMPDDGWKHFYKPCS
ncbi:hypothetical protein ACWDBF_13265 [Streptomyces angustmyceticus]